MEKVIEICVPRPHLGQKQVIAGFKRFNVIANGRRWGKTMLAVKLAMETLLRGQKCGVFCPTYDFIDDFWEEMKERLEHVTIYKSEAKKIIRLVNGGEMKIWSLEKARAGRGKKYHRIIVDEAAYVKDLKESWEKALRATLTDYQGDAYFLSSPVFGTYFHVLFDMQDKFDDWASFQMATVTNPMMPAAEIENARKQLDPLTFAQEYLAKFVNLTGRAFAYSFKRKKHVKDMGELRHDLPVYLSFDFNVDPITCIAAQHPEDKSYIYIRHEFRLKNSDIFKLCDEIKETLPGYFFYVTGDRSGKNRNAGVRDGKNYYRTIKTQLKLQNHQFKIAGENPFIKDSRVLCNSLLYRHPKFYIHKDCEHLIIDIERVQVTPKGEIDKTDKQLGHLLDAWRYYLHTFFRGFINLK